MALPSFIKNLFDANARDIERYMQVVKKVNALEPSLKNLSDEELRAKAQELKTRVQSEYQKKREAAEPNWTDLTDQQRREADRKIYDPILDAALPEAFALVREASMRTIGLRHYDVQLIGGMVLHDGRIAEMRTGEGKTLVATLPLFLNALLGKGVHLVTANDYLSKRDAIWNGPIYHLLGMSIGIIQGQSPETGDEGGSYIYNPDYSDSDSRYQYAQRIERKEAYACDITYGTNNEYGFDYLRDNMAFGMDDLVQRDLHYAIVDEVDSILIDEARTPLIISGMVEQTTDRYEVIDRIVAKMKRGIDNPKLDKDNPNADKLNPNIHYVVDEKQKTATITDAGVAFVEKALGVDNLADNHEVQHYLQASLKAHGVFRKDVDYVVRNGDEGPEIVIVDENTGRMMFGRRYSDGLHQAIEAKEQVEVKNESQTLATITFQNYFRLYSKLSGMTGTAKTEEEEFRKIYALDVVLVPTNKKVVRKDQPDMIYRSVEHKLRGITAEILRVYCKQQPTLVGTRSIETSERVSARLRPNMLRIICMVEVLRWKMESEKGLPKQKVSEWTAVLNMPMEPWQTEEENAEGRIIVRKMAPLTLSVLRPIMKEMGVSDDPLKPDNMNEIARIFEIGEDGYERLEEALTDGIGHNILNAKFHEMEALIIAEAGRKGSVTIATNMAGRGVDILLGGKHVNQELPTTSGDLKSLQKASHAVEVLDDTGEAAEPILEEQGYRRYGKPGVLEAVTTGALTDEEHIKAGNAVRELGGLYVLGTERHESRRIDNQLRGRSGRQGDPGESRFFVSMEDELMRLFGDRTNSPLLKVWEPHLSMDNPLLSRLIENAQKKVENHYFDSRKHVLNYDDVMNRQRELIYAERRRILKGVDLKATIQNYATETVASLVNLYFDNTSEDKTLDTLFHELNEFFNLYPVLSVEDLEGKDKAETVEFVTNHVLNVYESKEQEFNELQGEGTMRDLERLLALRAVNEKWMEHLANMDYLREGIGLRGYEQKDPLLIYQKEAFDEFERMQQAIQDEIVRNLYHIQVTVEPPPQPSPIEIRTPLPEGLPRFDKETVPQQPRLTNLITNNRPIDPAITPGSGNNPPPNWKGGRNDPCWCGSGQKYKRCHGK